MRKFGKLLLGFAMIFTLMGCNSQSKITDEDKELVLPNEIMSNSEEAFQNMINDDYELEYDDELSAISLVAENSQFTIAPIEDQKKDHFKFIDKEGEFIYSNEIKDESDPTLIHLISILKKYNTNMSSVKQKICKTSKKRLT